MGFAGAGQSEREDVGRALQKRASRKIAKLADERLREPRDIEGVEGLAGRQTRRTTEPVDAPLATVPPASLKMISMASRPGASVRSTLPIPPWVSSPT
jgi:hypothetical protein